MKKMLFVLFALSFSVFSNAGKVIVETGGGCPLFVDIDGVAFGSSNPPNKYESMTYDLCEIIYIKQIDWPEVPKLYNVHGKNIGFRVTEESYINLIQYIPLAPIVNETNE